MSEQVQKIRGDLSVTQTNMTILSDMLTELRPGQEHPEDRQLLEQLHGTCRAMQTRIVELIGAVEDDKLTADLLEINDNMNNLFLRYERFEKNRVQTKQSSQGALRRPGPGPVTAGPKSLMDAPLIDFSGSEQQQPPVSLGPAPSLTAFHDEDAEKLAEWIGPGVAEGEPGATSSEFDQFLAERAAAGDTPRRDK